MHDDPPRLPVLPLDFSLRKRRRMFNSFAWKRAEALRTLGLAVDFEKVDTDEAGDARCRVTVTEQQSGRVALAFLVYGEECGFVMANALAGVLGAGVMAALWYPGEEPHWGPEED